ncbi:MAG: cobalamin biosynthesis protein CbiD [Spirochaetes bacterium]|nr:MAG: cobalamin biosynthesis protein CbiD [Spirochaetota bacterium]
MCPPARRLNDHRHRYKAFFRSKDSGDDPDDTHGLILRCTARWKGEPGVSLYGGAGVGVATKPGLAVNIGEIAINPVPRRMILREVEPFIRPDRGVSLFFEVPGGEEIARKTWNPRLGIEKGISIIGTTGVVEPKSSRGYKVSVAALIRASAAQGRRKLILVSGYVGEKFTVETCAIPEEYIVTVGDHFGFALKHCVKKGCTEVYIAGHIGKLSKLAAGLFNTNHKYGDARLETIAALAAAEGASRDTIRELLSLKLAEAAVPILCRNNLRSVFRSLANRIIQRVGEFTDGKINPGVVLLDLHGNPLVSVPEDFIRERGWRRYLS